MLPFRAREVAMANAGFLRRRVFQHPFGSKTESVGVHSMMFALISGPIYYWQKRARLEAVILCIIGVPLLVYNPDNALVSRAVLSDIASVVWAGSVVLAPFLLALSYLRQGWNEIIDSD
jgi:hypothetical protein